MKAGRVAAAAALAATGVNAQVTSAPVSFTTVTYDVCPTSVVQSMVTITNGVTVTYCPECEGGKSATATPEITHTTVYTTTYLSLCPTSGTVPVTYTVTESCTGPTPTFNTAESHIPPDFTVTVQTCNVCGPTPVPVTITQPCGCKASEGVPMTQPTPAPTGTPDQPARPACPGPDCNNGNGPAPSGPAPAPMGPGCPGPDCKPTGPAPAPGTMGPACPGPDCTGPTPARPALPAGPSAGASGTGMANGGKPAPAPSQTTCPGGTNCPPPKTTYTGAASHSNTIGMASSGLVAVIAALAFGL